MTSRTFDDIVREAAAKALYSEFESEDMDAVGKEDAFGREMTK